MKLEEIQYAWDSSLISAASYDGKMYEVIKCFISIVDESQIKNGSLVCMDDTIEFINGLDIRRCKDRRSDGTFQFHGVKTPALAFIAARSPQMSACLMNKKHKPDDILSAINNFKWVRLGKSSGRPSRRKRRERAKSKSVIKIKAREIKSKHGWNTIK